MREERVAREYAEALFGAAKENGRIEEIAKELSEVLEIVLGEEFKEFFLAMSVDPEDKRRVFDKAFRGLDRLVGNFFRLVFEYRRERLLPEIMREYDRLVDEYRRRVSATITTVVELPDELATEILLEIEGALGKEVVLERETDPGLKGGYRLRVGDKVVDASIETRLRELRARLVGAG